MAIDANLKILEEIKSSKIAKETTKLLNELVKTLVKA